MKRLLLIFFATIANLCTYATHITGGELMYEYAGPGAIAGTDKYIITLRLFRDCFSSGPLLENEQARVGVYRSNQLIATLPLELSSGVSSISLNTGNIPCLTGTPRVCYQVAYYRSSIDLPRTDVGYTLVQTSCCRIGGIANIANSNGAGATYATKIPGTNAIGNGMNSSPQFLLKDTALVCAYKKFKLPFTAFDSESDSLTYSFCDAYGNVNTNSQPLPQTLQLTSLQYTGSYVGLNPLGSGVIIDPKTGIITGQAPPAGRYVVAVCATEWRNGVIINEHRKDFILSVQVCDFVSAELPNPRIVCDDFSVMFENTSSSSVITSYAWNFGDPNTNSDVSNSPLPVYTYTDTGIYKVKLVVRGNNGCIDSAEGSVHVYPGFKVNFGGIGGCVRTPVQFKDSSTADFGEISKWHWDFGVAAASNDTSAQQNPAFKYNSTGNYPVKLVAWSTKGCIDSLTRNIVMTEKPFLKPAFKDTVVCGFDTLQLFAQGNGTFSWQPNNFIINGNTPSPTVYPPNNATYIVTLNENGCIGTDTVRINKLNSINVTVGRDSSICTGDTLLLRASSAANYYTWSPATEVVHPSNAFSYTRPVLSNTNFVVNATLGKCSATGVTSIKTSPYPVANAGSDIAICMGNRTQLNGHVQGDLFSWSPSNVMFNPTSLQPLVAPSLTTAYVLTSKYNAGCPKPANDTVLVKVLPKPAAFAGNDTAIVVNQPLQLNAKGGVSYEWSPSNYLSNTFIANPVVNMPAEQDTLHYRVKVTDQNGCVAEDDIRISKFRTAATVFVPSGFTPNGDGKNEVLKPILAGIRVLQFFRIYNRWGQMIYETREHDQGWNGTVNGREQSPGTYVYVLQAIDYLNNPVIQKGTIVMLR